MSFNSPKANKFIFKVGTCTNGLLFSMEISHWISLYQLMAQLSWFNEMQCLALAQHLYDIESFINRKVCYVKMQNIFPIESGLS